MTLIVKAISFGPNWPILVSKFSASGPWVVVGGGLSGGVWGFEWCVWGFEWGNRQKYKKYNNKKDKKTKKTKKYKTKDKKDTHKK